MSGTSASARRGATTLDIGEVTERTGVSPSVLHVWERHGLLTPVGRSGLRRQYDDGVVARIGMIIALQRGGFTLAEIARLLASDGRGSRSLMRAKLDELHRRRREIDLAIEGIEHGLHCPAPEPFECARFRDKATSLLPVERPG